MLIVYHKPGRRGAEKLLERLTRLIPGARLASIEEALEHPRPGERAYLLMFTRGGHWRSLIDAGYDARLIPLNVAADAVASEAAARGAPGVALVILRAHRLAEEQLRDAEAIAGIIEEAYGLPASVEVLGSLGERPSPPPGGWAVAPLALLPGRLVDAACSASPQTCLGAFIGYGFSRLASWLIAEAYTQGLISPAPGRLGHGPERGPRG